MLQENRRQSLAGQAWTANGLALRPGVLHAAAYAGTDDGQFQLREHGAHLDERLAHGIDGAGAASDRFNIPFFTTVLIAL